MTTITRRIAASRRPRVRVFTLLLPIMLLGALLLAAAFSGNSNNGSSDHGDPNISQSIAGVTCATAHDVDNAFTPAVAAATNTPPNYDGVKQFGFTPPLNPSDVAPFQELLKTRLGKLKDKVKTVDNNTCVDGANGSGTAAAGPCPAEFVQHFDPNTNGRFVSAGVKNSDDILAATGRDARYLTFIANNLGLQSDTSANQLLEPDNKCLSVQGQAMYYQVKGALFNKNVTVNNNDQVPGNDYNTGMIGGHPVVDRSPGIGGNRAAVSFTNAQTGQTLYVMKRCGNVGEKSQGSLPPGNTEHERPPGSTPPPPPGTTVQTTTTTPPTCSNGGAPPQCLTPKDPNAGAGHQSNVPTQILGSAPPAGSTAEPRPSDPPTGYNSPAPPPPPTHTSAPPRTTPPETSAPAPSDPATGTVCQPGISSC